MNSPFIVSPFEIKQINEDEDYYIVEGMASVYGNVDLGNDIVEPGAFGSDLSKRGNERPILWQHDSRQPIGVGIFQEMSKGLHVKIMMPKSDQFVRERVMPQIKIGSVKGLSIGYNTEDYEMDTSNGKTVRRLKRCGLRETSAVTFPMNEEAQIMAAKEYLLNHDIKTVKAETKTVTPYKDYSLASMEAAWDKGKAVKQIREKTGSQEEPSSSYKNGFMYYDQENEDSFGAYKLPYVYVEGGSFKAVPRAIFAIAAALSGARGGVNIPEEDKNQIKAQINKYYKKMDREPPFKGDKTFINIETIKAFENRDFKKLFDENNDIILSESAKNYIIDKLEYALKQENTEPVEQNDIIKELQELNKELDKTLKGAKNV